MWVAAAPGQTAPRGGPLLPEIRGGDGEIEVLQPVARGERRDADEVAAIVEQAAARIAGRERRRSLHQIYAGDRAQARDQTLGQRPLQTDRRADGEDVLADREIAEGADAGDRRQRLALALDDAAI